MEILNGTQRAVQSAQMSNPSSINPQRSHPQHLNGLPTPGRVWLPFSTAHSGLLSLLQLPPPNYVLKSITNMCPR